MSLALLWVCVFMCQISSWQICFKQKYILTLKSRIEEHARLNFSDFLSTLLAIFHVINETFPPACLLIYLVISKQGGTFFPSLLLYSGLLFY